MKIGKIGIDIKTQYDSNSSNITMIEPEVEWDHNLHLMLVWIVVILGTSKLAHLQRVQKRFISHHSY